MYQYQSPTTYQTNKGYAVPQFTAIEREELITSHLGKVKYIADRLAAKLPPSIEHDDLYGAGVIGLIDAVERFDASRGIAFTTFAEMRVRGAILDNLRSIDWASRSLRKRAREIQAAYAEVEQDLGHSASDEQVAKKLNIPLSELQENLGNLSGLTLANLDERDETTGLSLADLVADTAASQQDNLEKGQQKRLLAVAIEKLPKREKQVIALYYVEELTMKEIGEILDVTESRVSQLRTQAIIRLRNSLSK
jgi:RNA polymerase sigma factor FliA